MKLNFKKSLHNKLLSFVVFSGFLLVTGCEEIIPEFHDVNSQEQTIVQYILDEKKDDRYSLFGDIIVRAGLKNLLSVRGPYTLFLPDNGAVADYYDTLGIVSHEDLDPEQCKELVYNHLTDIAISSGDIGLGALIKVNALGDYLSSEFSGPDIYINKGSLIIDRDVITANGVIHVVDNVIQPVHKDVVSILEGKEGFSIFYEGLMRTGLTDTLRLIEFEYGRFTARTRYTILGVSDEVYQEAGIYSIDELVNMFTNEPNKVTERDNGFFKYMEYHCIRDAYFMNHFEKNDYPTISNENFISFSLENDYEINKVDGVYTSFDIDGSNVPAKNGVLHSIDGILPAPAPKPWRVVFDITDYIDFRESDFYKKRETLRPGDNIFQKFSDGENTFEFIKWTGDYLQYYYRVNDWKAKDYINGDCLSMSGFWSIEVTTPRIMKGKYVINAFTRYGPDCLIYIDGVLQDHLYKMSEGGDNVVPRYIGTVDWTESTRHTIKLANINSGLIFYDRLEFVPVTD